MRGMGLSLLVVVTTSMALAVAACTGKKDDEFAGVMEIEPNDLVEDATLIGSSGTFTFAGSCNDQELFDYDHFRVHSAVGTLTATMSYRDDDANIDLRLDTIDDTQVPPTLGGTIGEDDTVPPDDSPISISANVTTAGGIALFINCLSGEILGLYYEGSVTVP